jgi:glycosyltransferase involved in cell wall biosynthesis
MKRAKLAIVCTHPIQYYAPVFRCHARSDRILPRVFYTWSQTREGAVFDPDFGSRFAWDIPLLTGYEYAFVENTAANPTSSRFLGIRTPGLCREIDDWGADAVLVYGWNNHAHLGALRHFHGRIPVLFRGDSTLLDPLPPLRRLARRACLRWVYSHVDVAVAVGQNNRDYYRWCGLPEERILPAPHSVDTLRFSDPDGQQTRHAADLRLQLGIAPDALVMLFAGKFIAKKDPLLLLEAFLALEAGPHLVFVGSGELEERIRERAAANPRVHFLPFQNQSRMPAVYRLADLYVLPSRGPGETWGLAMNEAMASGRPVVAGSRVGGARDLVRPGETGWVFESGNLAALRTALETAVSLGRSGLHQLGDTARARIGAWSSEAAARGIETAVLAAIDSTRGARS